MKKFHLDPNLFSIHFQRDIQVDPVSFPYTPWQIHGTNGMSFPLPEWMIFYGKSVGKSYYVVPWMLWVYVIYMFVAWNQGLFRIQGCWGMLLFSMKPKGLWQSLLHSQKHPKTDILLKEEIRNKHLECINLVNNGKNYLTIGAGFLPSTDSSSWK